MTLGDAGALTPFIIFMSRVTRRLASDLIVVATFTAKRKSYLRQKMRHDKNIT